MESDIDLISDIRNSFDEDMFMFPENERSNPLTFVISEVTVIDSNNGLKNNCILVAVDAILSDSSNDLNLDNSRLA